MAMDEVSMLALALDRSFQGRGWQGPTLTGALRGVQASEALLVPDGLTRCIWQHTLHAAYWKYAGCLRLVSAGAAAGRATALDLGAGFPRSPSNWPAPPARTARSLDPLWKQDIALLRAAHSTLMELLGAVEPGWLDRVPPGGKSATLRDVLVGLAAHDAYHTGQIQVLKRLVR